MIKVEIQDTSLRNLPFNERDGSPIYEQQGWASFFGRDGNVNPHPQSIAIRMEKGQQPFQPGIYYIHPNCLYTAQYGAIRIAANLRLIPAAEFGAFLQTHFSKKPLQQAA